MARLDLERYLFDRRTDRKVYKLICLKTYLYRLQVNKKLLVYIKITKFFQIGLVCRPIKSNNSYKVQANGEID